MTGALFFRAHGLACLGDTGVMPDVLTLIPVPLVGSATDADGRTVLLRPKFASPKLQWLQRLMWKPYFRVKLEARGAFVWALCDGQQSVGEIYAAVRERFGAEAEPVESRTGAFLTELVRGRFLRLDAPSGAV